MMTMTTTTTMSMKKKRRVKRVHCHRPPLSLRVATPTL
jgi:hypothetical protein